MKLPLIAYCHAPWISNFSSFSSCFFCGSEEPLTKDHLWPKSHGGRLMVPACFSCNSKKGDRFPTKSEIKKLYKIILEYTKYADKEPKNITKNPKKKPAKTITKNPKKKHLLEINKKVKPECLTFEYGPLAIPNPNRIPATQFKSSFKK